MACTCYIKLTRADILILLEWTVVNVNTRMKLQSVFRRAELMCWSLFTRLYGVRWWDDWYTWHPSYSSCCCRWTQGVFDCTSDFVVVRRPSATFHHPFWHCWSAIRPVPTAPVFSCRHRRPTSMTFSTTSSRRHTLPSGVRFWSDGVSEHYAWLRRHQFVSCSCRHFSSFASSGNIPYCIVLFTEHYFCVIHHHHRHHRVRTTMFWYYMFITATLSLITTLVLTLLPFLSYLTLMISWPWNLGQRSLKVIPNGTIRKLGCGFLFAFHSNYGSILHQFRYKAQ